MEMLEDEALGSLVYQYGWTRTYEIRFFDSLVEVQLVVPCGKGSVIEESQRAAFIKFDADKDVFTKQAQAAIFSYYLSVSDDCRQRFGEELSETMAPIITDQEQLASLIKPTQVILQRSFSSGDRVVGLLFTCSWEPELGLAVKFVNEEIEEIGPQDIVL